MRKRGKRRSQSRSGCRHTTCCRWSQRGVPLFDSLYPHVCGPGPLTTCLLQSEAGGIDLQSVWAQGMQRWLWGIDFVGLSSVLQ
eukprot:6557148-Prorocentrum_lima.AAC.1